jgi:hypothetical protein
VDRCAFGFLCVLFGVSLISIGVCVRSELYWQLSRHFIYRRQTQKRAAPCSDGVCDCFATRGAMPWSQPWYVVRRIVGGSLLYTRTTELSFWGRAFVPFVLLQALLTVGLSLSLVVIAADCRVSILLALLTLAVLAAAYFAVEAVRTENAYQLLAYALASAAGGSSSRNMLPCSARVVQGAIPNLLDSTRLDPTRLYSTAGMVGLALACTEGDGVGQAISEVFLGGS